MDEQTAIRRLKHGDIDGLGDLVRHYEVQAVRAAYLITHDRALAEDVVQTTFLRIYQHIHQYDEQRPFAPWLMRSVINAAILAAQRQQRDVSLDNAGDVTWADLLPDSAPGPENQMEQAELREAVWQALDRLSPEQRAAVVLRYFLEMSDDEMSGQLDISASTVRWRLHTARKQLRVLLRRWWDKPHWQEG
ncbi:MAG: sigma-70 family RNA polymerase sigma factor [Chloroflexi bacterium]|nr:sigma-70 family RNA polymerase sigma factor [Chloroflexota bacterium]